MDMHRLISVNYKKKHFTVTLTLIIKSQLKSCFKQFFINDMTSSTVWPEPSVVAIERC